MDFYSQNRLIMKHYYALTFLFIVFVSSVFGQQQKDFSRLHYLSKEEMSKPNANQRDFTPTDPPEGFIRNVAEFDQMQAVMVRYPFGIPVSLIAEMAQDTRVLTIVANQQQKQSVLGIYVSNNVDTSQCDFVFAQTDSYWTRDYGPFFIFDGNNQAGIVDFPYNRPRPNDNNIPSVIAQYLGINLFGMNLTHTGGNYMCNGMGQAASTDLVLEENPSLSEQDVDTLVKNYLGNDPYFITLDPLGEYIKHIDCWGKFLSPDKIMIGQVASTDPRYGDFEAVATFFANQISSYGDHYKVYRVFTPGTPQETPYTNSLILNKKVLVPITGSPWDNDAISAYEEAMPGYEIKGIYYSGWYNTDALHCRTKGIADINQLYIWHLPTLGNVDFDYSYPISATLYNYSGQPVYQDSVFIIYQINQGDFDTVLMSPETGNSMTYSGDITGAEPGDTVNYYLFAADASGHHANHPFIGLPDPHRFVVNEQALHFDPDTVWFQDENQMVEGIPLHIINATGDSVIINSITQFGLTFSWYIYDDDMPDFPYQLAGYDTLTLPVYVDVIVYREIVYDTMYIETPDKTYKELLMIDSALIDNIAQTDIPKQVTVYPNPVGNKATFKWNGIYNYEIKIFDLSGKLIHQQTGNADACLWSIDETNIQQGVYVYRISLNGQTFTGKVVKK